MWKGVSYRQLKSDGLASLLFFDFDIKYRTGKLNQAADALGCCPKTSNVNSSNSEIEEYKTISYAVVCDDLYEVIKGEKLPLDIKRAVQAEMTNCLPDSKKISAHSKIVDILSKVISGIMKAQETLTLVKLYAVLNLARNQPLFRYAKLSQDLYIGISINSIRWCFTREYCTGCMSKMRPSTTNSLPTEFGAQVMELLHDKKGHQAVEHTLQLVWEWFYWSALLQDVTNWVNKM